MKSNLSPNQQLQAFFDTDIRWERVLFTKWTETNIWLGCDAATLFVVRGTQALAIDFEAITLVEIKNFELKITYNTGFISIPTSQATYFYAVLMAAHQVPYQDTTTFSLKMLQNECASIFDWNDKTPCEWIFPMGLHPNHPVYNTNFKYSIVTIMGLMGIRYILYRVGVEVSDTFNNLFLLVLLALGVVAAFRYQKCIHLYACRNGNLYIVKELILANNDANKTSINTSILDENVLQTNPLQTLDYQQKYEIPIAQIERIEWINVHQINLITADQTIEINFLEPHLLISALLEQNPAIFVKTKQ